jgi:hypothetical protein
MQTFNMLDVIHRRTLAEAFDSRTMWRPPTLWWRFTPADGFDSMAIREMRGAIAKIAIKGEKKHSHDAVTGDAAAAIRLVLGWFPELHDDVRFDLAMTALAICGPEGNAAASLVASHVIRRLPGASGAEARIATSWLLRSTVGAIGHSSICPETA